MSFFDSFVEKNRYKKMIKELDSTIENETEYIKTLIRIFTILKNGDHDIAIQYFSRVIKIKPDIALAYLGRGEAYLNKRDYESSIQDYTQVILLEPDDAENYCCRGYAFLLKGDFDSSIQDYTQAIALNPDSFVAYQARPCISSYR